jgi:hypothetical protein
MLTMKYWSLPVLMMVASVPTTSSADPIPLTSSASSPMTWAVNGHEYAVIGVDGISWDAAFEATSALGGGWHLASITSAAEQEFVASLPLSGVEFWLGGFQDPLSTIAADENWRWVTGEAFTYTNWNRSTFLEPNDYYGPGSEQYLGLSGSAGPLGAPNLWNDEGFNANIAGYVIERASAPVPEPGSLFLTVLGLGAVGLLRRRRSAHQQPSHEARR